MQTQKEIIREHLLKHGKITSWEAIEKYHITRLAHYIYLLKKDGMDISSTMKKGNKNRPYAEYRFRKENEDDLVL